MFKAMFEHELKEKTCALIHVADVPTSAMRALLLYLYTGKPLGAIWSCSQLLNNTKENHNSSQPNLLPSPEHNFLSELVPSGVDQCLRYLQLSVANWTVAACHLAMSFIVWVPCRELQITYFILNVVVDCVSVHNCWSGLVVLWYIKGEVLQIRHSWHDLEYRSYRLQGVLSVRHCCQNGINSGD